MPHQIPVSSVDMSFKDGKFTLIIDGQPFNMRLLQKVELVIDASLMVPFVRLTAIPGGPTGVSLGNTTLEVQPGDPSKPVFADTVAWPADLGGARGPAYHGYGPTGPGHEQR